MRLLTKFNGNMFNLSSLCRYDIDFIGQRGNLPSKFPHNSGSIAAVQDRHRSVSNNTLVFNCLH